MLWAAEALCGKMNKVIIKNIFFNLNQLSQSEKVTPGQTDPHWITQGLQNDAETSRIVRQDCSSRLRLAVSPSALVSLFESELSKSCCHNVNVFQGPCVCSFSSQSLTDIS